MDEMLKDKISETEGESMINYEGVPLKPLKGQRDSLRYAGTLEDNVVLVTPPMHSTPTPSEDDHRDPHSELTPG